MRKILIVRTVFYRRGLRDRVRFGLCYRPCLASGDAHDLGVPGLPGSPTAIALL
jgi:hypothetical protein